MSENTVDNRYMEFRLGDQLFAVPLLSVREVIQKPDITAVPNSPADFEGMMNLRGQILGVFNIRKRLSSKAKAGATDTASLVIVIEEHNVSVGMIVDEVSRVLYAEAGTVKPAPLKDDDPTRKYVGSIIHSASGLVMVLNLNSLLELQKYKTSLQAA